VVREAVVSRANLHALSPPRLFPSGAAACSFGSCAGEIHCASRVGCGLEDVALASVENRRHLERATGRINSKRGPELCLLDLAHAALGDRDVHRCKSA
jgi:hypothetical protein